ncbi:hypothetical protein [Bifidobacterium pseudolongum]|uniref:Uncharacterized protein n=1 Tax=Bifidobacterium pseudolongum subsp. globosum TaxID=1690 RepID=A0A4Q5ASK6_9BIFI|nr:hypothetical protein [Bifidobacterium pseudolongum]RYQ36627.1 hypothetical protein PG2003B_1126 [Bifidobacterium pseudolongum subsp. globosum]
MGDRHRGNGPKSLTLVWLYRDHYWAVQADWIRVWHERLDLAVTPLYEAWIMCRETLKDHTSHMFCILADWAWIPTGSDQTLHALSQTGKLRTTPPWQQPMPWDKPDSSPQAHATDRDLRARLNARLGITDTE